MVTKPKSGPQDLPPRGGYNPIQTSRVALRRILSPTLATTLGLAATVVGTVGFYYDFRRVKRDEVELQSAQLAIMPLLIAERDRAFLKQLRKNREEEAKLMKDYPGWEVGTYFGEPIFHLSPKEELIEPTFHEYVAHANLYSAAERYMRYQFT